MKKGIATRWVKALRSGKYPQTHGLLQRKKTEPEDCESIAAPAGYCCLGVLQHCVLKLPVGKGDTSLSKEALTLSGMASNSGMLIEDARANPHVNFPEPKIKIGGGRYSSLATANDGGKSFKAIATWIEKNYAML